MKAIYKREVCAYFHAMTGWVFTAVVTAFTGIYFLSYNLSYGDPYFSTALNASLFVMLVMVPSSPCAPWPTSAAAARTSCC